MFVLSTQFLAFSSPLEYEAVVESGDGTGLLAGQYLRLILCSSPHSF
jgi:hypothetical protein